MVPSLPSSIILTIPALYIMPADGVPGADLGAYLGAPTPVPSSNADGADPVLPAPSQRPAPRPPRLPEDAQEFNDATIDALEAEVKQNKK